MSCNNLSLSYDNTCKNKNSGGVISILLTNIDDISSVTFSGSTNTVVTAITMNSNKKWYEISQNEGVASFSVVNTQSKPNYSSNIVHTVNFNMGLIDENLIELAEQISYGKFAAIVYLSTGRAVLLGWDSNNPKFQKGLQINNLTVGSGVANGDLSGVQVIMDVMLLNGSAILESSAIAEALL